MMSEENKQTLLREREAIRKAQREQLRAGSHARKKSPTKTSPAQLQREIDEALRKSALPGITDTFRRADIGPTTTTPRAPRRARVMFAVVSEGRDLGAYGTRARAQSEADKLPDAYVVETLRAPVSPGRTSHAAMSKDVSRTARSKPVSKPGPHGTLYRYSIIYTDQGDSGFGEATWNTWAYDPQHAVDRFYESPDGDTGWVALRIARQQEAPAHRWTWHSLGR